MYLLLTFLYVAGRVLGHGFTIEFKSLGSKEADKQTGVLKSNHEAKASF